MRGAYPAGGPGPALRALCIRAVPLCLSWNPPARLIPIPVHIPSSVVRLPKAQERLETVRVKLERYRKAQAAQRPPPQGPHKEAAESRESDGEDDIEVCWRGGRRGALFCVR